MKRQALKMDGLENTINKGYQDELQFSADIQFGVLSKKCNNFGICRIIPLQNNSEPHKVGACGCTEKNLAEVIYTNEHTLKLKFLISELSKRSVDKYFSFDRFKVEENFSTSFKLDLSDNECKIKIKKGEYPIIKSSEHYIIQFSK